MATTLMRYDLTVNWFEQFQPTWQHILQQHKPTKILEIGAYEGAFTTFLIDFCNYSNSIEIVSVDSWNGGIEHKKAGLDFRCIEAKWDSNTALAKSNSKANVNLKKMKMRSTTALAKLIAENYGSYFDLIYIDGSHQASDVLSDAVLAFELCAIEGLIVFDDYLWSEEDYFNPKERTNQSNLLSRPKIAIDSFVNIYSDKARILAIKEGQVWIRKIV